MEKHSRRPAASGTGVPVIRFPDQVYASPKRFQDGWYRRLGYSWLFSSSSERSGSPRSLVVSERAFASSKTRRATLRTNSRWTTTIIEFSSRDTAPLRHGRSPISRLLRRLLRSTPRRPRSSSPRRPRSSRQLRHLLRRKMPLHPPRPRRRKRVLERGSAHPEVTDCLFVDTSLSSHGVSDFC